MQLAADPIMIEIAGEAYELRPTLRAATRLARAYGDFANLANLVISDHVTASSRAVREGSGSLQAAADLLTAADLPGLRNLLDSLKGPLLQFIHALAGTDDEPAESAVASGELMTLTEYHAELFAIGTGWLGWSPEQTWEATPAEILAARSGRADMIIDVLKAVFGSSDTPAPATSATPISPDPDPQFDRAAFNRLKASIAADNTRKASAHG